MIKQKKHCVLNLKGIIVNILSCTHLLSLAFRQGITLAFKPSLHIWAQERTLTISLG